MKAFFRTVAEKSAAGSEADKEDKKKLHDLKAAVEALAKTEGFFLKSMGDFAANSAALHADLANVYPASEPLAQAIMALGSSSGAATLREAPAHISSIKSAFSEPTTAVLALIKALGEKVEERQVAHAEMDHYRDKVVKLANDKDNSKHQSKAETNTDKLEKNQKRFRELDAEIAAALKALDRSVAELYSSAVARLITAQANFSSGLGKVYADALAAFPGAKGSNPESVPVVSHPSAVADETTPDDTAAAASAAGALFASASTISAPAPAPEAPAPVHELSPAPASAPAPDRETANESVAAPAETVASPEPAPAAAPADSESATDVEKPAAVADDDGSSSTNPFA